MNKQNVIYLPVSEPHQRMYVSYWQDDHRKDVIELQDQYIFTRGQLAEYLANYSFHMSGAYNKNNAEKYIEGDWRNYKQE